MASNSRLNNVCGKARETRERVVNLAKLYSIPIRVNLKLSSKVSLKQI